MKMDFVLIVLEWMRRPHSEVLRRAIGRKRHHQPWPGPEPEGLRTPPDTFHTTLSHSD